MPSFSNVKYVYDPETLKMMGAAFDTACQSFPPDLKDHEGVRNARIVRALVADARHQQQARVHGVSVEFADVTFGACTEPALLDYINTTSP